MREIKFRAWDRDTKKMEKVNIINWSYPSGLEVNNSNVSLPFTLQQFTGLKDKNGKEIYDGDIYHQGDKNILYKVIFKDCYFIGNQIGNESLAGLSHFIKDIEVIGNIFENPELINHPLT